MQNDFFHKVLAVIEPSPDEFLLNREVSDVLPSSEKPYSLAADVDHQTTLAGDLIPFDVHRLFFSFQRTDVEDEYDSFLIELLLLLVFLTILIMLDVPLIL